MNLYLSNGDVVSGTIRGAKVEMTGEVVFTTGMTGYPDTMTDPSYFGQIVVFTFPLIGNFGVPDFAAAFEKLESDKIWVKGIVLGHLSEEFSHCEAFESLESWCIKYGIPIFTNVDTRHLTQVLRENGAMMGAISDKSPEKFEDPLGGRYVPEVSPTEIARIKPENPTGKKIVFIDCGAKNGILRNFLNRGIEIIRCPFDTDISALEADYDGVFLSNGPGDPETVTETIVTAKYCIENQIPTFGICLGNQMLALAAGGKTQKMKYGHRGANQPCRDIVNNRCIITSQNHGFEVDADSLPADFEVWFINLNDQSVEGIRHKSLPIFSVQFHPESCAGPEDANYLFDAFVSVL